MTIVVLALAAVLVASTSAASDAVSLTRHDYVLHCAGCHKFDGTGSARIPDLHGIADLLPHSGWREYVMRVPGVAQAPLSDTRLALLLDWVIERFGDGVSRPAFSAAEVGRMRTRPFRDPLRARADLLRSPPGPSP